MTSQAHAAHEVKTATPSQALTVAACCIAIILALVCGVGIPDRLVLRHLIQTLPLWFPIAAGLRRSSATGWVGLPLFVFWFGLMALIWLYLLHISHVISGHFSLLEIAMTVIVGISSLIGIGTFWRVKSLSAVKALGLFIGLAALQLACFRASFLPSIAHR